ncbi:MAG: hypothetical protein GX950_02870 [Candidatus Diapherotrites archaeon]|jgi:hypothetical protein|uniref:Uncharacterized protein n=1 Tax=Candidatus Iainarchaeum sp. TaxID=3101447 RepID=A0A7K4BZV7_9ARCH|nr:hypothetical protein [Candidatus Diapherotrites archaeon]
MPPSGLRRVFSAKKARKNTQAQAQTQIIDPEATRKALTTKSKGGNPKLKFVHRARALKYIRHVVELGSKGKRITGTPTIVKNPKLYGNLFKKGDRILYVHFEFGSRNNSVKQRDVIKLVKALKDPTNLQLMKEAGYVGLCGDTPTSTLAKLFEMAGGQNLGNNVIPKPIKAREKARYLWHVVDRGYPAKYLTRPLQRIVYRF